MNIFIKEFSEYLNGKSVIMVMDCAGWHKSKNLEVPENIKIVYLPPYSPELNPVERFWQYIKSLTIKNKVYDKIEELEDTICEFIKNLNPEIIKKTCHVNYVQSN